MDRDGPAAVERSYQKTLRKCAHSELPAIDKWLTEDMGDVAIRFLFEHIERRYLSKLTVLCTQYSPAKCRKRLRDGMQSDAMCDRLVHGSVRIDLGDVTIREPPLAKRQG